MILFEMCEVPVSALLSVAEAIPAILVKWCPSENMCRNVPMEVYSHTCSSIFYVSGERVCCVTRAQVVCAHIVFLIEA